MTIAEKRRAIKDFCNNRSCNDCPLGEIFGSCWDDMARIDRNYEILFGDVPPVNTCVACGVEIPEGRQVCPNCESEEKYEGCDNCAFELKEPENEPCCNCKNNMLGNDPRYNTAPFNWKPVGYSEPDPIKPEYYNDTKFSPFDVIDDWGLNFYLGNAIKYIKRAGKKANNSKLQDLKKVREYIDHEIRAEELITDRS